MPGRRHSPDAVSYTHLDVYKRQGQGDRSRADRDRPAAEHGWYRGRTRHQKPQAGKDGRDLERPAGAGLSLLGGEPMEPENQRELLPFVRNFKALYQMCIRDRPRGLASLCLTPW